LIAEVAAQANVRCAILPDRSELLAHVAGHYAYRRSAVDQSDGINYVTAAAENEPYARQTIELILRGIGGGLQSHHFD
jgi:hypothetical protein